MQLINRKGQELVEAKQTGTATFYPDQFILAEFSRAVFGFTDRQGVKARCIYLCQGVGRRYPCVY